MADKPLYEFVSHIQGKNAKVQIWPDRIEWDRKGVSGAKVGAGIATLGISTVFTGVRGRDTDMIPIKAISSVTSKKGAGFKHRRLRQHSKRLRRVPSRPQGRREDAQRTQQAHPRAHSTDSSSAERH